MNWMWEMGFARILTRSCLGSAPECRVQYRAQMNSPLTADINDRVGCITAAAHPCDAMRDDELLVLQLCENGQLDGALDVLFGMVTVPSKSTYLALLKRCIKSKAPFQAKQIHSHLARSNLQVTGLLGDYMVMTLAKCGAIEDAFQISNTLHYRTVFSWTAIISAYADCGRGREALQMRQLMEADGVEPNSYTFVSLLKACGSIEDLGQGQKLHSNAQMRGLTSDVFVGGALMQMYGKCGAVVDAENVFIALSNRDLVSWNNMILIYVEVGEGEKALRLYRQMQDEGVTGNQHTPVFSLQACRVLAEKEELTVERRMLLEIGQGIHADAHRNGLTSDVFIASTLVKLYGICGAVSEAEHAFDAVSHFNEVLWNSMLSIYVEHKYGERALLFYGHMQEGGMNFDQHTCVSALRACGILVEKEEADVVGGEAVRKTILEIVYALHADACMKEIELDIFFATTLLSMYGKCGGVTEAEDMFGASCQHDIVFWNAMLAAYNEQGHEEKALQMYRQLGEENLMPNELTYVLALQACGLRGEKERQVGNALIKMPLEGGHLLHVDVCKRGLESGTLVVNSLISMYGKCGQVGEAENVFIGSFQRVVVSWNVMLSAFLESGQGDTFFRLYRQMQEEGVSPDQLTFVMAFQVCGDLAKKEADIYAHVSCLEIGQALHSDAYRNGYASDVLVANTLVSMYGKLGAISEAEDVFLGVSGRDTVSWNAILAAYAEHDRGDKALQLYRQMHLECVHPDALTLITAFQACCSYTEIEASSKNGQSMKSISLEIGWALHVDVFMRGLESDVFIMSAMMSMYGKCRAMNEAEAVFNAHFDRDQVSWSAMLSAYCQQGQGEKALQLYRQMHEEGVTINQHTIVFLLQACGIMAEKEEALVVDGQAKKPSLCEIGQAFHSYASKKGWTKDVHVGNTLVSMYGKCGAIKEAECTFEALPQINVVSLNAMLSAYLEQGQDRKALQLYQWVLMEGTTPDHLTYAMTLQACGMIAERVQAGGEGQPKLVSYEIGQALHADSCRMGFASDIYVASTLVSMYGKCGAVVEAEAVFDELSQQNIVSCNAMLSAHVQHGQEEKALQLYRQMLKQCENMDEVSFTCLLQACSVTGSLEMCKQLHFTIVSAGYDPIPFVAATLLHAYGSCASMVNAHSLFDGFSKPDIGVWNACLDGHAREGNASASEYMFENLMLVGSKPDKVTFTSMISACSHTGLSARGLEYFECMSREYGINRDLKHYGCMLDLLGRAGQLERVQDILVRMPMSADLNIWLGLLGACRTHQNLEVAINAFSHAVLLQPEDAMAYVSISNIYAESSV